MALCYWRGDTKGQNNKRAYTPIYDTHQLISSFDQKQLKTVLEKPNGYCNLNRLVDRHADFSILYSLYIALVKMISPPSSDEFRFGLTYFIHHKT